MNKYIIIAVLVLLPAFGFAIGQVTPFKNTYDFQAQIEGTRGNIYLYETKLMNSSTTCVVASQAFGQSGSNIAIDCK